MARVKSKRFTVTTAVLVFIITFALGLLAGGMIKTGNVSQTLSFSPGKSYNILVMGIDTQEMEANSRSDTLILISIDKKSKDIAMVWIPRDTRVETGKNRYNKINSINYLQGPEVAARAVGNLLDVNVDYYVTTNFGGFAKIIDILGGVKIDVPFAMHHDDPDPELAIHLAQGPQILNGQDALRFVRYRDRTTADIGRTGRQQQFIKALAAEMFSTRAVLKLPQLLPEILNNIHTNIPMKDMLYLADAVQDFEPEKIITQTLPGYPYTDPNSGASYWVADEDIARGIVKELLAGEKFDVAQDPPQSFTRVKTEAAISPPQAPEEAVEEENVNGEGEEEIPEIQEDDLSGTQAQEVPPDEEEVGSEGEEEPSVLREDDLSGTENQEVPSEPGDPIDNPAEEPDMLVADPHQLPDYGHEVKAPLPAP